MSVTEYAVKNSVFTYFAFAMLSIAGIYSYFSLGQLEDPEFTVKTAVIVTPYPGATPEEVELEVTDLIEKSIQEMHQLDWVESLSRHGLSVVGLDIKQEYWNDRLPQVWDELRRKVHDVERLLPPGVGTPDISDDFGDVFGFQLAVTGDGFSYAELEKYAKLLKKELSLVKGIARIDLWGVQEKVIYLDVSQPQISQLGITSEEMTSLLKQQNMVVDAGSVDVWDQRMRFAPTGMFDSPEEIGEHTIRSTRRDSMENLMDPGGLGNLTDQPSEDSELIRVKDFATVRRGYLEPPRWKMRFNGKESLDLSMTPLKGTNVVTVGAAVDARLKEIIPHLPVGIEVTRWHWQSDIVEESVNSFLISFGEAVIIVLVILTLAMGWRMGVIIGTSLVVTILLSFIMMAAMGIDLQRMSLGALIIALGMMVDNAIVVADGIAVRIQQGMDSRKAAIEGANLTAWPLLGATVVAVFAFFPIFLSPADSGEYCRTLFSVVGISLGLSWLVAMTLTPLQCMAMLSSSTGEGGESYNSKFFQYFRRAVTGAIRQRWLTMAVMVGMLITAMVGFQDVSRLFFPDASMTKFMVDYWAPEGTRLQTNFEDLRQAEKDIMADDRVESVTTFLGQGPPRFYLPVDPEYIYPSYAQLVVNVNELEEIDGLIGDLNDYFAEAYPQTLVAIRKFGVGPSNTWRFEARFSGPAVADQGVLRNIADQAVSILNKNPMAGPARTDTRQRTRRVQPEYNQERARWAAVTRDDIGKATKQAYDGYQVGLYREGDDLMPIIARYAEEDRHDISGLDTIQVRPSASNTTLPLLQVVDGITTQWEDTMIGRYDRRRTVIVQTNPILGYTNPDLRDSILEEFEAIELPPGYALDWGAEQEDTVEAQAALTPGAVPALAIILLIIVALFNEMRPPLVIVLTIPFAMIGITAGLLYAETPFGFVALLGAMSLTGMMIKNSVVLLDSVQLNLDEGQSRYNAIVEAAVSRLRPVALAATTTVLGVVPLIQDYFWVGLSVTIMAGLTFGTILTMIVVPVLYCILYGIHEEK